MTTTLNHTQLQAVHYTHGPCLVLAGAGSGKTRVITQKIAHLIQTGMAPQCIVAITFTNKAAAEMRERSRALIGKAAQNVLSCTFHALGVRLLREDGHMLGLKPRFSILDTDDVTRILKDAAGGATDNAAARLWQWKISHWKSEGLNSASALAQAGNEGERQTARIMARYEERLSAYQCVDFDDLVALPLKLLEQHETIRQKWQQRFDHVLVDEYQDTNATQYALLRLLAGPQAHFTAVGDDDQSIYGWRGATLDNLKRLPQDYPNLKVIKLEQNYRSTNAILRAANNVIAPNPKLFPKTLFSALGEGEPVRVVDADHEDHEAERAVARIQGLRANSPHREWRDFAILYRANHLSRPLEKALRRAQIPYRISGGTGFFDRAEIRDLCSWLRLWINSDDDPAFLRAATTPKRGIGTQTLSQLGAFAKRHRQSLFAALFNPMLSSAVSHRGIQHLHEFGRCIHALEHRARHTLGTSAAREFLHDWLRDIAYEKHLLDNEDSNKIAAARWANVLDFCEWMALRCGGGDTGAEMAPRQSLLDIAQTVNLLTSLQERDQNPNLLTLSTMHAAKGLEWSHVILAGVNEDILPFRADGATPAQAQVRLEEERRLMYVGITRAQRTLTVSWVRRRKKGRGFVAAQPSRFIAEMALGQASMREDPRARLKALRAEFAKKTKQTTTSNGS